MHGSGRFQSMQDENKARTKQAGRIEVAELAKGVLGRPIRYPDGTPADSIDNRAAIELILEGLALTASKGNPAAARELREWLTKN